MVACLLVLFSLFMSQSVILMTSLTFLEEKILQQTPCSCVSYHLPPSLLQWSLSLRCKIFAIDASPEARYYKVVCSMCFDALWFSAIISVYCKETTFILPVKNIICHFIWLLVYKIHLTFILCLNHCSPLGIHRYWTLDDGLKCCKEQRLSSFLFCSSPILIGTCC